MRMLLALSLGLGLAGGGSAAQGAGSPTAGCAAAAVSDRIDTVTPDGDLRLASGRTAQLAGIRLAGDGPARRLALAWLRERAGRPMHVQALAGPDRWDRVPVLMRAGETGGEDVARALLEIGLALVDPGPQGVLCRPEWLAVERLARERSLGLWAEARYNPLEALQMDRASDRIGTFVLVEGRVRTVGERGQRTYLNFGEHWAEDFTIVIPKGTWKLMADRGLGAQALKGRRIRARGILQAWQGTALTVASPEMIERLDR